jgi:signal transduction histidine kinase
MKKSLKSKYHLLVAILFGIIALQTIIMLFVVSQGKDLLSLASDLHSVIIIFVFGLFVYIVVLYNYIPFKLHKAIKEVEQLVERISTGNYQIDIDSSIYDQDKDFQSLIFALEKMLGIITRFDQAKADKIFEHHQRIQLLINLIPQSVLITGANGDVVYCNENLRKRFPMLTEMVNLNELIWKNDYHVRLFAVILDALRYGNNIYNVLVEDLVYLHRVLINGSIIRNRKGLSTGAVYVLDFTDHEKQD